MELSTIKCEFLYAECFQTFHCTYRLFFIFEVCYGLVLFVLLAAISGISVLAVPLDLLCSTCYFFSTLNAFKHSIVPVDFSLFLKRVLLCFVVFLSQ